MTLYSFVTRWDHGFAPNPFHGWCTLATCKPRIRKRAQVGDWVLGTGSKERGYDRRVIFLMRVTEITTYDGYWRDPRFAAKRPVLNGSFKQMFGDNIYHRPTPNAPWIQADSRHSYEGAVVNEKNLRVDTGHTDKVLLSNDFVYWGEDAPTLPSLLAEFHIGRVGELWAFSDAQVAKLLRWALSDNRRGRVGDPLEWRDEYVQRWR